MAIPWIGYVGCMRYHKMHMEQQGLVIIPFPYVANGMEALGSAQPNVIIVQDWVQGTGGHPLSPGVDVNKPAEITADIIRSIRRTHPDTPIVVPHSLSAQELEMIAEAGATELVDTLREGVAALTDAVKQYELPS